MENLTHSSSVVVRATPEAVYDLVSDVTRTGEWSPQCRACWWDDGAAARVGAGSPAATRRPERTWETRSQVVAADRGREFAWLVGGKSCAGRSAWSRWTRAPRLTESWEFLPAGSRSSTSGYGDAAEEQIDDRTRAAHEGIPQTLDAIRRIAEAG